MFKILIVKCHLKKSFKIQQNQYNPSKSFKIFMSLFAKIVFWNLNPIHPPMSLPRTITLYYVLLVKVSWFEHLVHWISTWSFTVWLLGHNYNVECSSLSLRILLSILYLWILCCWIWVAQSLNILLLKIYISFINQENDNTLALLGPSMRGCFK